MLDFDDSSKWSDLTKQDVRALFRKAKGQATKGRRIVSDKERKFQERLAQQDKEFWDD